MMATEEPASYLITMGTLFLVLELATKLVREFLAEPEIRKKPEGAGMRLIRLFAARGCFRVSTWLAVLGKRLAGL